MAKRSKFFRVAVEGGTTDGRVIEKSWIDEIVQNFNTATYGPRINIEHIKGFSAEPPFNAYGDVVAVKAETIDLAIGGKTEKRRALYAQVDALDNLVALNEKQQKIYTSVEISPNFGGSGKAGLVGLAFTDSPASLGTEVMTFAAGAGDASPFASRKADKTNLFTAADADGVKLEYEPEAQPAEHSGLLAAATAFFKQFTDKAAPEPKVEEKPAQQPANDNDARFSAMASGLEKMTAGIEAMGKSFTGEVTKLAGELAAVKASIESTDAGGPKRAPATGGKNFTQTDC